MEKPQHEVLPWQTKQRTLHQLVIHETSKVNNMFSACLLSPII